MNLTIVETQFHLDGIPITDPIVASNEIQQIRQSSLIQDLFVSCSVDKDRSYSLTINLELDNPFKVIDFKFKQPEDNSIGQFRINLPRSTFLIQLNQRIRYDECLDVKYVQLGPNIEYEIECLTCNEAQKAHLNQVFTKRMNQFDSELDSVLSEKMLLALNILLNQQRLDYDLFLS